MKVMIIITRGDTIGGAQTHVFVLAKNLILRGAEVLVVYGGNKSILHDILEKNNISSQNLKILQKSISIFQDFRAVIELKKIAKEFKPDILSLHSSKAGILGRIVAQILGIKNILTVHGWSFTDGVSSFKRMMYILFEKSLAKATDKFILVSKYDLELALKYNITSKNKLVLIYNGIEDLLIKPLRSKPATGDLHLCMVARFDHPKDQKCLIRACQFLDNTILHFYGDGPELESAKQLSSKLNMDKKVNFHGFSSNIENAMVTADVFVLISNWEGFPISTLEAMSMGLPLIISDVGGACECVLENVNGFKVPRGDQERITRIVKMFMDNRALGPKMGEQSRRIFLEHYTADIMISKTIEIYKEAMKGVQA